jgi:hypothetical protein
MSGTWAERTLERPCECVGEWAEMAAPGPTQTSGDRRAQYLCEGHKATEGVSKLEFLRFSGVTLPLPKGYEANTARSDESTFSLAGRGARFDTVWARSRR